MYCGVRRGERGSMIEIIREEESGGTTERRGLPKDIKQMGKPDIGDRIYVENEVYQFLHPYSNVEEKSAYVLLGRFENFAGRECVFVEAAIFLEEIAFDGDLPRWNDQTWAYIYKQLRREFDSMVIVGWAMDIKGQLPNMTTRVEQLHQSNFGGAHQVLFLMDSLEREEAFYGNKNGHLYRREGFYVYYDKKTVPYVKSETYAESEAQAVYAESKGPEEQRDSWDWRLSNQSSEEQSAWRGSYRQQAEAQKERRLIPSYASTLFLATVVCVLGVTAYLNNEKMRSMEETLAQMNQTPVTETQAEAPEVTVENVAGNVQKQEDATESLTNTTSSASTDGVTETTLSAADAAIQTAEGTAQSTNTAAQSVEAAQNSVTTAEGTGTAQGSATTAQGTGTAQSSETTASSVQESTAETSSGSAESTTAMTEAQTYLNQGYYIVQKGDSLVGICKKIYQTTAMMDKLCEVNEIDDADAIYAGQKLILPN